MITHQKHTSGNCYSVVGDTYRIIISGKETNGEYAVIDMMVPPGGGPGPHSHTDIHESFYVVEGEVEFTTEQGKYTARKGDFINIPKGGDVHAFKNVSGSIAHLLCTVMPSGLEEFFAEAGVLVEAGTYLPHPELSEEDKKKLQAAAEKHGQKLFPPGYLDK